MISRRALLLGAGGLAVAGCAGPAPLADPLPVSASPRPSVAPLIHPFAYRRFGLDVEHSAFPSICRLPDGRLRMAWRTGASHTSRDGVIMSAVGSADGGLWESPTRLDVGAVGALPSPSFGPSGIDTIDGSVFLTYFPAVAGRANGAHLARSVDGGATFGAPVRIDQPPFPLTAISTKVSRRGDGMLHTAYYGYARPADAFMSCWYATSRDGVTWTSALILDGVADGRDYQEPCLLERGARLVILFRWGGWDSLGVISSTGDGHWTRPVRVLEQATGPGAVWCANGDIVCVYRRLPDKAAGVARSRNAGLTWRIEPAALALPAGKGIGMTYAAPIETAPGRVFCPIGYEDQEATSHLWIGYLP